MSGKREYQFTSRTVMRPPSHVVQAALDWLLDWYAERRANQSLDNQSQDQNPKKKMVR